MTQPASLHITMWVEKSSEEGRFWSNQTLKQGFGVFVVRENY